MSKDEVTMKTKKKDKKQKKDRNKKKDHSEERKRKADDHHAIDEVEPLATTTPTSSRKAKKRARHEDNQDESPPNSRSPSDKDAIEIQAFVDAATAADDDDDDENDKPCVNTQGSDDGDGDEQEDDFKAKKKKKKSKKDKRKKKKRELEEVLHQNRADDEKQGVAPTIVAACVVSDEYSAESETKTKKKQHKSLDEMKLSSSSSSSFSKKKPPSTSATLKIEDHVANKDSLNSKTGASPEKIPSTCSGLAEAPRPIVESSAVYKPPKEEASAHDDDTDDDGDAAIDYNSVTLLLFYQYVEPPWSEAEYKVSLKEVEQLGLEAGITGRMRVAKEGLNCTLTGTRSGILNFCRSLRRWKPQHFLGTEFKLTHDLLPQDLFPAPLKIIPVLELVHYGLEGDKAPPIALYHGTHLEPQQYHEKLAQPDTVVIDVRNHYEANIGRFAPPPGAAEWIDPKMRKSTEFPVWLDSPETKEKLRNKQVLMYCTGGIRCERASALLKYKMDHDPAVQELGIQGVYQLQGGIDKYFKEFPDGGFWKGKNYVFDRRYAHAPPAKEGEAAAVTTSSTATRKTVQSAPSPPPQQQQAQPQDQAPMGQCEGCGKPWDKYRGKRRCPTCGVPSLTCRDCWQADVNGIKKLGKSVRCDLCVEQGITSKHQLRQQEAESIAAYERKMKQLKLLHPPKLKTSTRDSVHTLKSEKKDDDDDKDDAKRTTAIPANPQNVTRLFLKNMCKKSMNEEALLAFLPGITHIAWHLRRGQEFTGQGWVEMESPEAAARAVAKSGQKCLSRNVYIQFQPPNAKDNWPPPNSAVGGR